ncbi:MAG: hypothetical protein ACK4ZN_11135 [Oceanibaculum sp.]
MASAVNRTALVTDWNSTLLGSPTAQMTALLDLFESALGRRGTGRHGETRQKTESETQKAQLFHPETTPVDYG